MVEGMTRTTLLCASLIGLSGLVYACSSLDASSAFGGTDNEKAGAGDPSATPGDGPFAPPEATGAKPIENGVILVHAAKSQSFRLCFKDQADLRPQPDSQAMPEANVVGVEVGSAVRIAPLAGVPGEVILFEEPLIRPYYPVFGGGGASCKDLLASSLGNGGISLGKVTKDLSSGVHLLVVRGCPPNNLVNTHDVAECGETWTADKGNLGVTEITLVGADSSAPKTLPAQVINLSQPLEGERAGRDVVVTFGGLAAAAPHAPVVTNPELFKQTNETVKLGYDSDDPAIYDAVGFRVSLVAKGGGAPTTRLEESLAAIQRSSASRDLPSSYYAAASNYALLLLGDPDAKLPDGGRDTDLRRSLHFLAVPVIEPKPDAGTEPPPPDPVDPGATPPLPWAP